MTNPIVGPVRRNKNWNDAADIWAKIIVTDGCWHWCGRLSRSGYGQVGYAGKRNLQAHRVVYEMERGPVADGLHLDHLCRNRACVRPDHMDPVSGRVNILRGQSPTANNSRKTHCAHGHELSGDNLGVCGGRRFCRACKREFFKVRRSRIGAAIRAYDRERYATKRSRILGERAKEGGDA